MIFFLLGAQLCVQHQVFAAGHGYQWQKFLIGVFYLPEYGVEHKADGKCYYFLLSSQDSSYIINCFLHGVFYLIFLNYTYYMYMCGSLFYPVHVYVRKQFASVNFLFITWSQGLNEYHQAQWQHLYSPSELFCWPLFAYVWGWGMIKLQTCKKMVNICSTFFLRQGHIMCPCLA